MTARPSPLYVESEMRFDRPEYDNQTPSTLILLNGTLLCSFHRPFLNICGRLVIAQHRQEVAA